MATARFNYTSYDARHMQDTVKPCSHTDVMVLSHEDETSGAPHPYWYARVVGIFYVFVRFKIRGSTALTEAERFNILWVRWFGLDSVGSSGWAASGKRHLTYFVLIPS
jgi:hypothetical protein